MMTHDVVDKVRKLLRLSTSSNAHEAALAAAKAQELIDRHQLAQVTLELETPTSVAALEPIQNFHDAPLDRPTRLDQWRGRLASCLARANACRIYFFGPRIMLIGRASDAETVRYLYAWLVQEVDRLAEADGAGKGRTWRNNFRHGVVDGINAQLKRQRQTFAETMRHEASGNAHALVRVNQALARMNDRQCEVDAWMREHLNLAARRSSPINYDAAARDAGRQAGASIAIGKARRGLSSGTKRLTA